MEKYLIALDFGKFVLPGELFDTKIAKSFMRGLPYNVDLIKWGNELYGSIGRDLGEESPVEMIPEGGLAYTNKGSYICIFFGQTPAWPVEYIGQITGDIWRKLVRNSNQDSVIIRLN